MCFRFVLFTISISLLSLVKLHLHILYFARFDLIADFHQTLDHALILRNLDTRRDMHAVPPCHRRQSYIIILQTQNMKKISGDQIIWEGGGLISLRKLYAAAVH